MDLDLGFFCGIQKELARKLDPDRNSLTCRISAEMELEVRKKVLGLVEAGKDKMEEQTGGLSYSVTEKDVREYMQLVMDERKRSVVLDTGESKRNLNEQDKEDSE